MSESENPNKKLSTTVYLTIEQRAALKALAEATHVPFATFVREGIDMRIEAEEEGIRSGKVLVRP